MALKRWFGRPPPNAAEHFSDSGYTESVSVTVGQVAMRPIWGANLVVAAFDFPAGVDILPRESMAREDISARMQCPHNRYGLPGKGHIESPPQEMESWPQPRAIIAHLSLLSIRLLHPSALSKSMCPTLSAIVRWPTILDIATKRILGCASTCACACM